MTATDLGSITHKYSTMVRYGEPKWTAVNNCYFSLNNLFTNLNLHLSFIDMTVTYVYWSVANFSGKFCNMMIPSFYAWLDSRAHIISAEFMNSYLCTYVVLQDIYTPIKKQAWINIIRKYSKNIPLQMVQFCHLKHLEAEYRRLSTI